MLMNHHRFLVERSKTVGQANVYTTCATCAAQARMLMLGFQQVEKS